jgi:peptidoglycan pentaglycine glycine transferase (the first glycine)
MILKEVTNLKDFDDFVFSQKQSIFMHASTWGKVMEKRGFIVHYLLFEERKKTVGSAIVLEKRLFDKYPYFYCPRSFLCDNELETITSITDCLKKYVKQKRAIYFRIDPELKRYDLDYQGKIVPFSETNFLEEFLSMGYLHRGFNKDFSSEQPRFTFELNLEGGIEKILKKMSATNRNIFNRNNPFALDCYIGNESDIDKFIYLMKLTKESNNIITLNDEEYKNFYNILNEQKMCDLYVVSVHSEKLKETYKLKINDIENTISLLEEKLKSNINVGKNTQMRIIEEQKHLDKLNKENEVVTNLEEGELLLSATLVVKFKNKSWTVHGANNPNFKFLFSNNVLHNKLIKDSIDYGIEKIDFFGASGDYSPSKDSPIYGLHTFKKNYGGEYVENIGEFDLVGHKFLYLIFTKLVPLRRKIISFIKKEVRRRFVWKN